MNLFESFVKELKEENLLENTVIEKGNGFPKTLNIKTESIHIKGNGISETQESSEVDTDDLVEESFENTDKKDELEEDVVKDFYKQRAMDEVMGLQMVEHVLSGIEREQMKSVSAIYNDIKVKQALHNFLKIEDVKSPEHAQAEFQLMQETEDWYSSLSRRDRNIVAAQFRRFCEETKPSLSSRALMALARFYRNSPYSEPIRSKFDLIVTRLFTKEIGNDRREILFSKEEISQHLKELYADWSSVPLYSVQEDDSEILLCVLQFQEFIDEVQSAEKFNDLIQTDFFKRVKVFKEKTSENFFSPQIVSAAIECNVVIGNKYVELIEKERNQSNLGEKYGVLYDEAISEATSKTLELIELLKEKKAVEIIKESPAERLTEKISQKQNKEAPEVSEKSHQTQSRKNVKKSNPLKVNKWLLVSAVIIILFSGLFYYTNWNSSAGVENNVLPSGVKQVNLERSFLNDHIHEARISQDTFFAISKPSWNLLEKGEKENFLRKIRSLGKDKDFKKVMIIDEQGKVVASAGQESIDVNQP